MLTCKQSLDDCLAAVESLGGAVRVEIRQMPRPVSAVCAAALEEVRSTVNSLLQKKRELEPDEETASQARRQQPRRAAAEADSSGAPRTGPRPQNGQRGAGR